MSEHPDRPDRLGTSSQVYSASGLSPGLTIDSATGSITGRIDLPFTAAGQNQRGSPLSPDGKTSNADVPLLVFSTDLHPGVGIGP